MVPIDMQNRIPTQLTDSELVAEVTRLASCERQTVGTLIAHLSELDARRLYLGAGFPSLFQYCRKELRLSEHEAFYRIVAARTAARFPMILARLEDGSLNLTTVRLLGPHLTVENHADLVAEASGRGKRRVLELLARRFPRPDVPPLVRKLPPPVMPSTQTAVPVSPPAAGVVRVPPPPPPRPARRRHGGDRGPCAHPPRRAGREGQIRHNPQATFAWRHAGILSSYPRRGEADGLAQGGRPLCLRGDTRALRGPWLPGVPPCDTVRCGRSGHG
jgi:hypothetical protein